MCKVFVLPRLVQNILARTATAATLGGSSFYSLLLKTLPAAAADDDT